MPGRRRASVYRPCSARGVVERLLDVVRRNHTGSAGSGAAATAIFCARASSRMFATRLKTARAQSLEIFARTRAARVCASIGSRHGCARQHRRPAQDSRVREDATQPRRAHEGSSSPSQCSPGFPWSSSDRHVDSAAGSARRRQPRSSKICQIPIAARRRPNRIRADPDGSSPTAKHPDDRIHLPCRRARPESARCPYVGSSAPCCLGHQCCSILHRSGGRVLYGSAHRCLPITPCSSGNSPTARLARSALQSCAARTAVAPPPTVSTIFTIRRTLSPIVFAPSPSLA